MRRIHAASRLVAGALAFSSLVCSCTTASPEAASQAEAPARSDAPESSIPRQRNQQANLVVALPLVAFPAPSPAPIIEELRVALAPVPNDAVEASMGRARLVEERREPLEEPSPPRSPASPLARAEEPARATSASPTPSVSAAPRTTPKPQATGPVLPTPTPVPPSTAQPQTTPTPRPAATATPRAIPSPSPTPSGVKAASASGETDRVRSDSAPLPDIASERRHAPDRRVEAALGQDLEVPFGSLSWVFVGEADGRAGVYYDSRRLESGGLVFRFKTLAEGDYLLRFIRQDLLSGTDHEEWVLAIVRRALTAPSPTASPTPVPSVAVSPNPSAPSPTPNPSASATASPVPTASPGAAALTSTPSPASSALASPSPQVASAQPAPGSIEEALLAAKALEAQKKTQEAIDLLVAKLESEHRPGDELLWTLARLLESDFPGRSIKRSHAFYKRLMEEYPDSIHWDAAAERKAFIERFYMDIR